MLFGDVPIHLITKSHIKALIRAKRNEEEYAADSVRLMYGTVRHILNCACGDELIPVNPADKLPPHIKALMKRDDDPDDGKPLTAEQFKVFLAVAQRCSKKYPLYLAA